MLAHIRRSRAPLARGTAEVAYGRNQCLANLILMMNTVLVVMSLPSCNIPGTTRLSSSQTFLVEDCAQPQNSSNFVCANDDMSESSDKSLFVNAETTDLTNVSITLRNVSLGGAVSCPLLFGLIYFPNSASSSAVVSITNIRVVVLNSTLVVVQNVFEIGCNDKINCRSNISVRNISIHLENSTITTSSVVVRFRARTLQNISVVIKGCTFTMNPPRAPNVNENFVLLVTLFTVDGFPSWGQLLCFTVSRSSVLSPAMRNDVLSSDASVLMKVHEMQTGLSAQYPIIDGVEVNLEHASLFLAAKAYVYVIAFITIRLNRVNITAVHTQVTSNTSSAFLGLDTERLEGRYSILLWAADAPIANASIALTNISLNATLRIGNETIMAPSIFSSVIHVKRLFPITSGHGLYANIPRYQIRSGQKDRTRVDWRFICCVSSGKARNRSL